jgi:hypothetical protein
MAGAVALANVILKVGCVRRELDLAHPLAAPDSFPTRSFPRASSQADITGRAGQFQALRFHAFHSRGAQKLF